MKVPKLVSVVVLTLAVSLSSCKNDNPKELIVNKWKLQEIVPSPNMQITDSMKADMVKSATMEFTSDNKYTLTGMGETQNGSYSISDDGRLLTIIPADTKTSYVDTIIELTKKKIIIMDQMGNKLTSTN